MQLYLTSNGFEKAKRAWGIFYFFVREHPEMDEDELSDKFYTEVVSKKFQYGEYGSFEIIVDENFNIVGGRIF
jgi:hypothetical protein